MVWSFFLSIVSHLSLPIAAFTTMADDILLFLLKCIFAGAEIEEITLFVIKSPS